MRYRVRATARVLAQVPFWPNRQVGRSSRPATHGRSICHCDAIKSPITVRKRLVMRRTSLSFVAAALALSAALAAAAPPDPAYLEDLAKWRTRADASLTRERGWLSIVSRDELSPGTYKIGSAPDNQVVLPKGLAPAHLGTITVGDDKARLALAPGQKMQLVTKDNPPQDFTARDLVTGATRLEWVTSGPAFAAVRQARGRQDRRARRRSRVAAPQELRRPRLVRAEARLQGAGQVRAACRAARRFRSPTCAARSATRRWRARWSSP